MKIVIKGTTGTKQWTLLIRIDILIDLKNSSGIIDQYSNVIITFSLVSALCNTLKNFFNRLV